MSRLRYLIIIGFSEERQEGAPAECPHLIHDDGWTRIYTDDPGAAWALPDRDGVLLGRIFPRNGVLPEGLATNSMPLRDEDLQASCWGDYLVVRSSQAARASVYRPPGAAIPCYRRSEAECTAIASDVSLLNIVFDKSPSISWKGVGFQLVANGLPAPTTGLAGVIEIERGTRLTVTRLGPHVERLWSPWDFVKPDYHLDQTALAGLLRETVIECVRALAPSSETNILSLSGGLDSSIIAAAAAAAGFRPQCFTMVDATPSGNEQHFAQAVAQHLGFDLDVRRYEMDDVDIVRPTYPNMPRPIGRVLGQTLIAARRAYRPQTEPATLWTGIGGDNVFCFLHSASPVADSIVARRWAGSWKTLLDVSRLSGASVLQVGIAALKRISRPPDYVWRPNMLFINAGWTDAHPVELRHPWLEAPPGSRHGSAAHIANVLQLQAGIEEPDAESGWEQINPFLSQPVVELCLGIPSWIWCAGGRDRAVARAAFSPDLPAAIIDRRHKGGPEGFCIALLERHRKVIREALMEGNLAKQGLLDRQAIETALADGARFKSTEYLRLLELADAEAWTNYWTN